MTRQPVVGCPCFTAIQTGFQLAFGYDTSVELGLLKEKWRDISSPARLEAPVGLRNPCWAYNIGARIKHKLFSQTFRAPPGHDAKNPGIFRQKSLFSLSSRDIPNFLAPTLACGRPPSHRTKKFELCSFFLPDNSLATFFASFTLSQGSSLGHHATKRKGCRQDCRNCCCESSSAGKKYSKKVFDQQSANWVHCTMRGSEMPTFLAIFLGASIFSGSLFSRNPSTRTFTFNKSPIFTNTPCKSTCL